MLPSLLLVAGVLGSGCTDTGTADEVPDTGDAFEFMIETGSGSVYTVRTTGTAQRVRWLLGVRRLTGR
jgi:hypothetical protein